MPLRVSQPTAASTGFITTGGGDTVEGDDDGTVATSSGKATFTVPGTRTACVSSSKVGQNMTIFSQNGDGE